MATVTVHARLKTQNIAGVRVWKNTVGKRGK